MRHLPTGRGEGMDTGNLELCASTLPRATLRASGRLRHWLAAAALALASMPVAAGTIPLFVDQSASTSYGTGDNAGGTFGDTDIVAMSYFIGTGAGTTGVRYTSSFALDYPDRVVELNKPFALWFRGWQSGSLTASSTFAAGAGVNLWVAGEPFSLVDKMATIATGANAAPYTVRGVRGPDVPPSPLTRSASDCVDFDVVDILLLSGGGSFCVEQEMRWNITTAQGKIRAQLGAYDLFFPFFWTATAVDSAGSYYSSVYLDLPEYGWWTLSIPEFEMLGWTESHIDVDLCAQVDVPFADPFRFGCGAVSAYGTPRTVLDFPLGSLGPSFRMLVSEPDTLLLVAMAALLLTVGTRARPRT